MSRVECDHCGARYDVQGEASVADPVGSGPTATCRECGAPARRATDDHAMTPTPIAAIRDTASLRDSSDDASQEEPPTARSPVTYLEDVLEDEKTIALPVTTAAAAAEAGRNADAAPITTRGGPNVATVAKPATPLDEPPEEEIPNSATPSMDALIQRVRSERSPRAQGAKSKAGAFLESSEYDLRPPDIQVEPNATRDRVTPAAATRTVKTDAPVAGTQRPPAPERSSNHSGVVIGLLVSAGLVIFAMRGIKSNDDKELPPLPAAPPTLEEATRSVEPAPAPVPATNPAPADATAALAAAPSLAVPEVPAPQASPPAAKDAAPSSLARAPRNTAPVVPASLTARGDAVSAEKDAPTEEVPADEPPAESPFNATAASSALDKAVSQASTCRKAGDPSGVATVTITFSPSGRVTTATISGPPFAGTETGGCIASRLRSTRVPAFSGDFITVKKTVTIQ